MKNRLEKLENRASSLVGRAMREVIEKASKSCLELYEAKKYAKSSALVVEDGPIESAPLYQKFRGLSYRLRELSALVLRGPFADALALNHHHAGHHSGNHSPRSYSHKNKRAAAKFALPGAKAAELEVPVINEVKQGYVVMRNELLLPFIREAWVNSLRSSASLSGTNLAMPVVGSGIDLVKILEETNKAFKPAAGTSSNALVTTDPAATAHASLSSPAGTAATHMHISLCTGIRQAFSTLLRVTQLELQLYESLFLLPAETAGEGHSGTEPGTPGTPANEVVRSPRALVR